MELIRKYLGSSEESKSLGAETVENLVDRLQSSVRLDDRRDALRALKALSRKYRLEVGTLAMPAIVESLKTDSRDSDIICYALEAIMNVMSDDLCIDLPQDTSFPTDLGGQFTEIFIKDPDNVKLVIFFIDAYDLHIRRFSIRLLSVLLSNRLRSVQDIILKCPMAISKIVDTLSDSREALRNDGLLLLIEASKGHSNIQKIVAFENVFERILNIIDTEGLSDGGIVVEDCLKLLRQLLESNPPNQTLFKEGSYIQRLNPFVSLSPEDIGSQLGWSAQKVVNVKLMLQVIRLLVSPNNKAQVTQRCQIAMNECGLLSSLCNIIMAHGVPLEVLTEAIYAVAEVIRGCSVNQAYLSSMDLPSDLPHPAVTALLLSMVNDRQSLVVRQAVLYCFQCFLCSNQDGQAEIVATLLPKTAPSHDKTPGQLLCRGLFSHDSLSTWFSAVAFLHLVRSNRRLKDELLRVNLGLATDSQHVSLLQQTYSLLSQELQFQARLGVMQFLCVWLSYSPSVVHRFLGGPSDEDQQKQFVRDLGTSKAPASISRKFAYGSNLSLLIAEAAGADSDESETLVRGLAALLIGICIRFNPGDIPGLDQATLIETIDKRIGIDVIVDRLSQVSKSEAFIRAMKQPQPYGKAPGDLLFDYEFTRLYKNLEYEVVYTLQPDLSQPPSLPPSGPYRIDRVTQHSLHSDIARVSPSSIDSLGQSSVSQNELFQLRNELAEKKEQLKQTRQELEALHMHYQSNNLNPHDDRHSSVTVRSNSPQPSTNNLDAIYLESESAQIKIKLEVAYARIKELENQVSQSKADFKTIKTEHEDLLEMYENLHCQNSDLKKQLRKLGKQIPADSDSDDSPPQNLENSSPTKQEPGPNVVANTTLHMSNKQSLLFSHLTLTPKPNDDFIFNNTSTDKSVNPASFQPYYPSYN